MDEIVWAVTRRHDTFEGLMDYISAYGGGLLRVAGIRCRMAFPLPFPVIRVDADCVTTCPGAEGGAEQHREACAGTEVWLRLQVGEKGVHVDVRTTARAWRQGRRRAAASGRISSGSGPDKLRKATGGRRAAVRDSQRAGHGHTGADDGVHFRRASLSYGDWPDEPTG